MPSPLLTLPFSEKEKCCLVSENMPCSLDGIWSLCSSPLVSRCATAYNTGIQAARVPVFDLNQPLYGRNFEFS